MLWEPSCQLPFPGSDCHGSTYLLDEWVIPYIPPSESDSAIIFISSRGDLDTLFRSTFKGYRINGIDCISRAEVIIMSYIWSRDTLFTTQFSTASIWFTLDFSKYYNDIGYLRPIGQYHHTTDSGDIPLSYNDWEITASDTLQRRMVTLALPVPGASNSNKILGLKFLQGTGPIQFVDAQNVKWKRVE